MVVFYFLCVFVSWQDGDTPLTISAATGHSEVVDLLCQRGANIEARNNVSCVLICMCL